MTAHHKFGREAYRVTHRATGHDAHLSRKNVALLLRRARRAGTLTRNAYGFDTPTLKIRVAGYYWPF